MRRLVFAVALAACGHAAPSGPSWPAPSTTADDGGESLDPRSEGSVAATLETADDDEPAAAADDKPAASDTKPATIDDSAASTTAAPQTPSVDDVLNTEEIIIEIDD